MKSHLLASNDISLERPQITDISDPVDILSAMIKYRKKRERSFSVLNACQSLPRTSPTLVSLIIKRKRTLTVDRIGDLSKLMGLTPPEKSYFSNLVMRTSAKFKNSPLHSALDRPPHSRRKNVGPNILSDWLNVYVKDCFHISAIQNNPNLLYRQLGPLASNTRIQKALDYLLKEGHLRRTLDSRIEIDSNLTVTDQQIPNKKVRDFHKAALNIARQAIDLHPPFERYANTLLICLSKRRYFELIELIQNFAESLKEFAEDSSKDDDRLYQFIINLSPTGGRVE